MCREAGQYDNTVRLDALANLAAGADRRELTLGPTCRRLLAQRRWRWTWWRSAVCPRRAARPGSSTRPGPAGH